MADTPTIREATSEGKSSIPPEANAPAIDSEDVPILLSFMHATAAEQGVASSVTATPSDILDALCLQAPGTEASQPSASERPAHNARTVVIVAPEGEIAGMATYFTSYVAWNAKSGLFLEDLFVLPAYRRRKYARLLVQHVAQEAHRLGCARVEWLCFKNNERALSFYRGTGAKELDAVSFLRLEGEALVKLAGDGLGE